MQAAWDRRRSKQDKPVFEVDAALAVRADGAAVSVVLRRIAKYVIDLETAAQKDAATIAALEQEILDINAELMLAKQHLQITADEYRYMKAKEHSGRDW